MKVDDVFREHCQRILDEGTLVSDRTGVGRIKVPGAMLRFNLAEGFPQLGLRHIPYRKGWAEMDCFCLSVTNAQVMTDHGCDYWLANANDDPNWTANPFRLGENDLGPVYGAQWRSWQDTEYVRRDNPKREAQEAQLVTLGYAKVNSNDETPWNIWYRYIDQLTDCIREIITNPGSSRILFHAWNPGKLHRMALPPCHMLYQFIPLGKKLNMIQYIRSSDTVLGLPTNISQAAYLLSMVAHWTSYEVGTLTVQIGDAHLYSNHLEGLKQFINQPSTEMPRLVIDPSVSKVPEELYAASKDVLSAEIRALINGMNHQQVKLEGYTSRIKLERSVFPMAV